MAEILTEQIAALKAQQQQSSAAGSSSTPSRNATPSGKPDDEKTTQKQLPKGVVLDKDGKPCRTCTSAADWRALMRMGSLSTSNTSTSSTATATTRPTTTASSSGSNLTSETYPSDCPPDVEDLGRSTWTLLHTMAATYPPAASPQQQGEMRIFLSVFSKLYPCGVCADDFRTWMNHASGLNTPRLKGRAEFGNWMCEAHNEVNKKLGKKEFDCAKWEERWRTGWKDGRCD